MNTISEYLGRIGRNYYNDITVDEGESKLKLFFDKIQVESPTRPVVMSETVKQIITANDNNRTAYCFCFFDTKDMYFNSEKDNNGAYKAYLDLKTSKSKNVDISVISNIPLNEDVKNTYAALLFNTNQGMNLNLNIPSFDFKNKAINHIYGEETPEIYGYDMIIGSGFRRVNFKTSINNMRILAKDPSAINHMFDSIDGLDQDSDGIYDFDEIMFEYTINAEDPEKSETVSLIDLSDPKHPQPYTYGQLKEKISKYNNSLQDKSKREKLFYVEKGLERYERIAKRDAKSPVDSLMNIRVLPIKSDPTSGDGDEDGITDYDDSHWNGIDTRYEMIDPLYADTIETLYPELVLDGVNGNNKTSNPVYLKVSGNTITINAKVCFVDPLYNAQPLIKPVWKIESSKSYDTPVPLSTSTKTKRELFKEAIISDYWCGDKKSSPYDFYPGMKITINTKIDEKQQSNDLDYSQNCIYVYLSDACFTSYVRAENLFGMAGGNWSTNNKKFVNIFPCYFGINHNAAKCPDYINLVKSINNDPHITYTLDDWYKELCAHEFGHTLGLWDAYGDKTANNYFQITYPNKSDSEFYNYDIMRDEKKLIISENPLCKCVTANDIEMILQGFIENSWQFYYESQIETMKIGNHIRIDHYDCEYLLRDYPSPDQKLSKAIKYPVPTYEIDVGGGYYDYYYYDRKTNSIVKFAHDKTIPKLPS